MTKKPCEWGQHEWVLANSKSRSGWVAAACRKCGKFLGRCPMDKAYSGEPGASAPGGVWAVPYKRRWM